MLAPAVVLAAFVGGVAALLFQGVALLFAYEMPRLDPAPADPAATGAPSVSVVIAARDEEDDLARTLDGLLAQDLPGLEIVVVDGGSRDGTRAVAQARGPRVRLLEEPPLPDGWVGKNWACWTGAQATHGAWLLFLDADVRLHPAAVRSVLAWAEREGAAVATVAPKVEMLGRWERVVLPFYVQMVLTYFRAPHVNRPDSRAALVNGQFWLVRREEYDAVGGHAAVRRQILEDIALARRFRASGRPIRLAWGPELATTRMYREPREMFEGLLKNIHGTNFSAARQAAFLAGLIGFFWLPLAVLPVGVLTGNVPLTVFGGVLALALFGKHVAWARAVGAPARYGLTFPMAVGVYVALVATSLGRGLRGGTVAWKGRSYPLERGTGP